TSALFSDSVAPLLGSLAMRWVLPAPLQAVTSNAAIETTRTERIDVDRCELHARSIGYSRSTMRPSLLLLLTLVIGASTLACRRTSTAAKDDFARRHSCPGDRVTVKERSDVRPASLL